MTDRNRLGYFRLTPDPGAIPALDGLRGIAILLVVLHHVSESFAGPDSPLLPIRSWDAMTPLLNGWIGVQLFFVLSGFLITHHLLRLLGHGHGLELRRYFAKRWLRIVPTYYVVLAVVALRLVPHYPVDPERLGLRAAYHALFLQDYLPSSLLGPFWSLGVEEKFYIFAPILALLLMAARGPGYGLAALGIIALAPALVRVGMVAGGESTPMHEGFARIWRNPFHLSLDALVAGAIVAWLAYRRDWFPRLATPASGRRLLAGGTVLLIVVAAARVVPATGGVFDRVALYPAVALAMGCIVAGAVLAPGWCRPLENRWLARAGRIAYPWYLTHVLVMWWLWGTLGRLAPALHELAPRVQFALFLPAYLTVSVVAALLLHFAVEKPCLILKDTIDRRARPAPSLSFSGRTA